MKRGNQITEMRLLALTMAKAAVKRVARLDLRAGLGAEEFRFVFRFSSDDKEAGVQPFIERHNCGGSLNSSLFDDLDENLFVLEGRLHFLEQRLRGQPALADKILSFRSPDQDAAFPVLRAIAGVNADALIIGNTQQQRQQLILEMDRARDDDFVFACWNRSLVLDFLRP
jgi:hypothetical protein